MCNQEMYFTSVNYNASRGQSMLSHCMYAPHD
jgi:hypothetical protein